MPELGDVVCAHLFFEGGGTKPILRATAKRVAGLGRILPENSVSRHPPPDKMWQPAHFRLLTASFALLVFHFQLFTSGFSLKLFVLCLKQRTASIPTLASKG